MKKILIALIVIVAIVAAGLFYVWQNLGSLSIVLAWGLVGLVGAIRGFRWQPRESL